jgi:hypothetical protein
MKTSFYRAEHIAALERKNRIWRAVLALVCAATLGVCLCFILRRNTLNAARMEFYATAAMTVGGWIAITIRECALRYGRALREHEARILASEEEPRELRGLVTLDKKTVHVSRSIDVRGVRVKTEDGAVRLLVNAAHAKALEKAAAQGELTLRSVEGYITEVER